MIQEEEEEELKREEEEKVASYSFLINFNNLSYIV